MGIIIYMRAGVARDPKPKMADGVGANSKALQVFKPYLRALTRYLNWFNCIYKLWFKSILDSNLTTKTAFKPA